MIGGVIRRRFWIAGVIGFLIFAYTIKQADFRRLAENFQSIDPAWMLLVLLTGALSYLCIAAVLYYLLKNIRYALPFYEVFQISLLSCTLNYLMALGGLSGVAAKVYLLSREKIPPSNTLSISMVHGFLTNTIAVLFIYLGFFFLYSEHKMDMREVEAGVVVLIIAFLLTWLTVKILIDEMFRKRLWRFLQWAGSAVCSRMGLPCWLYQEKGQAFFDNFNTSMNLLVGNSRMLVAPTSCAALDWLLMFLCLKCSFLAVHYPVDNSTLLVGFSIGLFTSLFSLTPASIGLMEGSMAGSFYLMGLDYEHALVATLIYRFAYYLLPVIISLLYYKRFFPSEERLPQSQEENQPFL